jgi:septal ring factor EnvC (AmiA/AmiB activator)
MIQQDGFLPTTLNQWLGATAILVGWTLIAWRHSVKVTTDLNNVGTRVNELELKNKSHETEIDNLKLTMQRSIDDRNTMRERIASNARSLEELRDEIRDDRLAVLTTLHNNERAAAERDAGLRVQLAQLQERINIEELVKSVIRNHGGNVKN